MPVAWPDLPSLGVVRLERTVRFVVNPCGQDRTEGWPQHGGGFSGRPIVRGLAAFYEITVQVEVKPDTTDDVWASLQKKLGSDLADAHV